MIKRGILLLIVITLIFIISKNIALADVPVSLNISPGNITPPQLVGIIPNQTWAKNTNLTNAFDLDDYFFDYDSLNYNSSGVENISITIDSTTHLVSFFPDYDFEGSRSVIFNATNSFFTNSSNIVYLNVINDTSPPTWSNPTKDKTTIYQNTVVKFYTNWEDFSSLNNYIFSIDQGGGFINYTSYSFTGRENTSNYTLQISATGGTIVYWKFFAYDIFGFMNVTDTQNFTVNTTTSTTTPGTGTGTGSGSGSSDSSSDSSSSSESIIGSILRKGASENLNFTVDPLTGFNIELIQGSSGIITIKVINLGSTLLDFEIEVTGLEEFKKTISNNFFNLTGGESKSVTIEISSDKNTPPGIYYGVIKIKTKSGIKEIPIILILKAIDSEYSVNVNIPKEYKFVKPGRIVKANVTIENLKEVEVNNISMYYAIIDYYGNVINSKTEDFIFSERIKIFNKELEVPLKTKKGEYLFLTRVISGEKIALDTDEFQIGEGFTLSSFIRANFLFFLIILASIILALLMAKHHRNKERLRLLNLYMMVTQLNKLIKEGKPEEALDIYIRIKSIYGEPVSKTIIQNKTELISEMKKLAETIDLKLLKKAEQQDIKKSEKIDDNKIVPKEEIKEIPKIEDKVQNINTIPISEQKKLDDIKVTSDIKKTEDIKPIETKNEIQVEKISQDGKDKEKKETISNSPELKKISKNVKLDKKIKVKDSKIINNKKRGLKKKK